MLNVHRNTVGPWFAELEKHGLIGMTQAPHLGPSGIGKAALWSLQELPTVDGKPATKGFLKWQKKKKPRTKVRPPRHKNCAKMDETLDSDGATVLKIVTGG